MGHVERRDIELSCVKRNISSVSNVVLGLVIKWRWKGIIIHNACTKSNHSYNIMATIEPFMKAPKKKKDQRR